MINEKSDVKVNFNEPVSTDLRLHLIKSCYLVEGQSFAAVGEESSKDWVCIGGVGEMEDNEVDVYPGISLLEAGIWSEVIHFGHAIWMSLEPEVKDEK